MGNCCAASSESDQQQPQQQKSAPQQQSQPTNSPPRQQQQAPAQQNNHNNNHHNNNNKNNNAHASHPSQSHAPHPGASTAGDASRQAASQHAVRRGELMQQSQDAWNSGDKALAKKLSDQGKHEGKLMEEANARAAQEYFKGNNAKHGIDTIDLHGLHVDESIQFLTERLEKCEKQHQPHLVIIVGRGNHTKGGPEARKIKPAVEKLVAQHKLGVSVDNPNAGCVTVYLNSAGGKQIHGERGGKGSAPGGGDDSASECVQQ